MVTLLNVLIKNENPNICGTGGYRVKAVGILDGERPRQIETAASVESIRDQREPRPKDGSRGLETPPVVGQCGANVSNINPTLTHNRPIPRRLVGVLFDPYSEIFCYSPGLKIYSGMIRVVWYLAADISLVKCQASLRQTDILSSESETL